MGFRHCKVHRKQAGFVFPLEMTRIALFSLGFLDGVEKGSRTQNKILVDKQNKILNLGTLFFLTNATGCTICILGLMRCYNHTTSYKSTTNKDALLGEKDSRGFKD